MFELWKGQHSEGLGAESQVGGALLNAVGLWGQHARGWFRSACMGAFELWKGQHNTGLHAELQKGG